MTPGYLREACLMTNRNILLAWLMCCSATVAAQDVAKSLFESSETRVYQIRVIDIASGDKYSIGSGFAISADGGIATNFHVVSSYVHDPDKYRLESVAHDGRRSALSLSNVDVVHDLSILQMAEPASEFLPLASQPLQNGDRLYSMGNPLDLGMTIIEGTYNGLVENSRYQKILFSGSLNSGMSGGPALNEAGEVIGINVSKGEEQISFLVPVMHLAALLNKEGSNAGPENLQQLIHDALLADQREFYQRVLNQPIKLRPLGELEVPDQLEESLRCWGHSVDDDDKHHQAVHQHCRSEDQIYISENLYVGDFYYDYEFIHSEALNRFQFYTLLQSRFDHKVFSNTQETSEVSDFRCHTDIVELNASSWKVSSCLRGYKKYNGLYDATMAMASVDYNHKGAIVKIGASGVSLENANAVFKRMMESVQWTH
jgi:serine protease Do